MKMKLSPPPLRLAIWKRGRLMFLSFLENVTPFSMHCTIRNQTLGFYPQVMTCSVSIRCFMARRVSETPSWNEVFVRVVRFMKYPEQIYEGQLRIAEHDLTTHQNCKLCPDKHSLMNCSLWYLTLHTEEWQILS